MHVSHLLFGHSWQAELEDDKNVIHLSFFLSSPIIYSYEMCQTDCKILQTSGLKHFASLQNVTAREITRKPETTQYVELSTRSFYHSS
jgi:hypothetical protein